MRHLRLDELREGPSVGSGRRLPVRAAPGLRASGASGYRGEVGETVVPQHDESGGGSGQHEELYVPDFGDWAREQAAHEPLLDAARD